jgi:DNA-directed RNA polymerase I subunit RPA1
MGKLRNRGHKILHLNPSALSFSIFTRDEIQKLSQVKITTPLSFNALGHPLKGGLYDPALGMYIS